MSLGNESRIKVKTVTTKSFVLDLSEDEAKNICILLGNGITDATLDHLGLRGLSDELDKIFDLGYVAFKDIGSLSAKPVLNV
jgi:hypothetical protein